MAKTEPPRNCYLVWDTLRVTGYIYDSICPLNDLQGNRQLTGISCPIFGISWSPVKLEIEIARKVILFLEDKRVLYVVYELESPRHCLTSIIQIREFLTSQLFDLGAESKLSDILRAMRNTCRRFLDAVQGEYYFDKGAGEINRALGMGERIHFYNAMGELRATMGLLIAEILIMHGINCESDLISIIPLLVEEEPDKLEGF